MRGIILILIGILYLVKPNLFQRGIFMKYRNAASTKTPEEHQRYMKIIAIILIVIGFIILIYDNFQLFTQNSIPGV